MSEELKESVITTPEAKVEGGEEKKKVELTIPKSRFDEVNNKSKELQKRLDAIEEKEKKESEAKLLEEKKYDELIKAKDLELEAHKTEKELLKRNMLLEKVSNKIINIANKEGAIDSEDILRFIKTDDLLELDSDKLTEEISKRVTGLKNNKAHLFTTLKRDSRENGNPYSANTSSINQKPMSRDQQIEEALKRSYK